MKNKTEICKVYRSILCLAILAFGVITGASSVYSEDMDDNTEVGEWEDEQWGQEEVQEEGLWNMDNGPDATSEYWDNEEKGYWQQEFSSERSPKDEAKQQQNINRTWTTTPETSSQMEEPAAKNSQAPEIIPPATLPEEVSVPSRTPTATSIPEEITVTAKPVVPESTRTPVEPSIPAKLPATERDTVSEQEKTQEAASDKHRRKRIYYEEILIKKGKFLEIRKKDTIHMLSVRINKKEKSWKETDRKILIPLPDTGKMKIELAFIAEKDLSWTETKKNAILTYNLF